MSFLKIYRLVIFTLCTILSIPVLGLAADLTQFTTIAHIVQSSEVMSLLIASVSLLVFPLLLVVSTTRKNAMVLYVVSELSILTLVWILWVTAAGLTIQAKNNLLRGFSCSIFFPFSTDVQKCNELVAAEGIEIVIFVLLLKYLLVLFVYTLVIYFRDGNGQVWYQTVEDLQGPAFPALTHKSGDLEGNSTAATIPMNTYATSAPTTYNTTGTH